MNDVQRLMFVCSANVCRSQFASLATKKLLLSNRYHALNQLPLQVGSSGMFIPEDKKICSLINLDPFIDFMSEATLFNPLCITQNTLIFVMERRHQSELVSEFPQFRKQIFPMKIASLIARKLELGVKSKKIFDGDSHDGEYSVAPYLPNSLKDRWSWIVEEFSVQRGLLQIKSSESGLSQFDIPDVHGINDKSHPQMFDLIENSLGIILEAFESILDEPSMSRALIESGNE